MSYTTIDNPELYFQIKTYTGTGSARSITLDGSEDMQPDWVWIKNRGLDARHMLYDVVRGVQKTLFSNLTTEETAGAGHLTAFNSNGFSLGDNSGTGSSNGNTETYVAWNWKAGGSASSNTDGDQTTSVSASTTAGFSICAFTEAGSAPYSFGHGLGVEPDMVWLKSRANGSNSWQVYFGALSNPNSNLIQLNNTNASTTAATWWGTINSSIVTINAGLITPNTTAIAYCFAGKKGYSKFGTFIGNGNADGTFVYTGFKPAWVFVKKTSASGHWVLIDNKRDPLNVTSNYLLPDNDSKEESFTDRDLLSNGFKMRNSNTDRNASGATYIYMAFAESPFVNSNGVPNNAR